ncbi:hypothetical protein G7B40_009630 [Aetokthonos hydrillicola Thurmond2011]|jgi:hypothetical protein|uniref:Uncharacterized protein n=1 Tax=Aetokthonos hydrillicola Thurmond2011 TaxID=2712845 RepID=A0AAP5I4Z5_9CYAN|nr:hypothetical protein [Aetokthonos hydrillicola]MBO3461789.1 hypothetical protein [Aetokthonos hydrillicola CCALA 1050]MBW4590253.1 hypothetical protein [Aetokthonos hydrillicola CCALA 1050]MDR9894824.1 hypothetical protein [Aetokthonos hydrillicola Thurmond2011]
MISFIKNLISGIVNFFLGLFGGKKDSGYYLELQEDGDENNLASKAKKAVETAATNTQQAVQAVTENTQQAVEAVTENTKKAVKSVKETVPAASNGKKDAATTIIKPSEVELVQTAKGVKAQAAKKEKTPTPSAAPKQPEETTFAPKYLTPTNSNGRRRPGANMNSFLDMARQVKTPN